jgi:hypothetical protein
MQAKILLVAAIPGLALAGPQGTHQSPGNDAELLAYQRQFLSRGCFTADMRPVKSCAELFSWCASIHLGENWMGTPQSDIKLHKVQDCINKDVRGLVADR